MFSSLADISLCSICLSTTLDLNLRSKNPLQLPNVKTARYGIENFQYIGHHLRILLPEEIKDLDTLINFKQKIKSWKGRTCICRLCTIFINEVGFLQFFFLKEFV